MRQIVDGVFELRVGFVNVHLVVVDDGVVLIDTGLPGRRAAARIESALHDVRRAVGEVTTILLTHKHPDHTGGVAELRRRVVHAGPEDLWFSGRLRGELLEQGALAAPDALEAAAGESSTRMVEPRG